MPFTGNVTCPVLNTAENIGLCELNAISLVPPHPLHLALSPAIQISSGPRVWSQYKQTHRLWGPPADKSLEFHYKQPPLPTVTSWESHTLHPRAPCTTPAEYLISFTAFSSHTHTRTHNLPQCNCAPLIFPFPHLRANSSPEIRVFFIHCPLKGKRTCIGARLDSPPPRNERGPLRDLSSSVVVGGPVEGMIRGLCDRRGHLRSLWREPIMITGLSRKPSGGRHGGSPRTPPTYVSVWL